MKNLVYTILKEHGISPGYKGFRCILESVLYVISLDNSYGFSITKEVYPHVAKLLKTEPLAVERNFRTALQRSNIKSTNREFLNQILLQIEIEHNASIS